MCNAIGNSILGAWVPPFGGMTSSPLSAAPGGPFSNDGFYGTANAGDELGGVLSEILPLLGQLLEGLLQGLGGGIPGGTCQGAQFGIQGNAPQGKPVFANNDATLPDGTTVKFDGAGTVQLQ
ncbi:MAG: hypothetical protein ACYCW6_28345 [Candidatus Xenobia bacterium]